MKTPTISENAQLIERIRDAASDARRFGRPYAAEAYDHVVSLIEEMVGLQTEGTETFDSARAELAGPTWQEKVWTVPDETRLSRKQFLEAIGRGRTWLYRGNRLESIPHRKDISGDLVFAAGEVRKWIRDQEIVINPGNLARENFKAA